MDVLRVPCCAVRCQRAALNTVPRCSWRSASGRTHLIPDFGYLDELVLVPLGVLAVRAMIPPHVMQECRDRARTALADGKPVSRIGLAMVIGIWLALAAGGVWVVIRLTRG